MATFINYNDATPAAPSGYVNVKWQKDAAANVSAYVPVGAGSSFQTPWLQDVDADNFSLVDANSVRFRNANGERIRLYDSGGINHAFGVESGTMYQQVATNSVHRWYVGAAPDGGVSTKMELGWNLGLKNTSLVLRTYGAFVGFNAEYTDAWRYSSNGPAGVIMTLNNVFALYTAPPGTAGAVANVNPAFTDDGANFTLSRALLINSPAYVMGSNAVALNAVYNSGWKYAGPGTHPALAMYADAGSNRVTVMCASAGAAGTAISFPAVAHFHQNAFQVMVPLILSGLPTSASGLASGSVWRDAAAGNVLKMVP